MPHADKTTIFPIIDWTFILYTGGYLLLNLSFLFRFFSSMKMTTKRAVIRTHKNSTYPKISKHYYLFLWIFLGLVYSTVQIRKEITHKVKIMTTNKMMPISQAVQPENTLEQMRSFNYELTPQSNVTNNATCPTRGPKFVLRNACRAKRQKARFGTSMDQRAEMRRRMKISRWTHYNKNRALSSDSTRRQQLKRKWYNFKMESGLKHWWWPFGKAADPASDDAVKKLELLEHVLKKQKLSPDIKRELYEHILKNEIKNTKDLSSQESLIATLKVFGNKAEAKQMLINEHLSKTKGNFAKMLEELARRKNEWSEYTPEAIEQAAKSEKLPTHVNWLDHVIGILTDTCGHWGGWAVITLCIGLIVVPLFHLHDKFKDGGWRKYWY